MGLRTVAVHSTADAGARHVRAADTAVCVGGAALSDSYLNAPAIVAAAQAAGARMVHPGYGFLAENAAFARLCAEAGLVFIGPPPEAIEAMGDKIRAKREVAAAGVPLLPGFAEEPGRPMDDTALERAAADVGYPLLIKPSAGGGGKGMRVVEGPGELAAAAAAARREARAAFGDDTLLVERLVRRPRHIEVQVLADAHGNVVHLGERECSLQRRHQKIVEEAPSPLLTPEQRAAMGRAAVAAARACGYVGAGTVEFIVQPPREEPGGGAGGGAAGAGHGETGALGEPLSSSQPEAGSPAPHHLRPLGTTAATADGPAPGAPSPTAAPGLSYAFLEMNTRLQVEHPVTEAVVAVNGRRGIDLVELQVRVARGEPLPFTQEDLALDGHAVESRVYAEDPAQGFLPTGGRVLLLAEPEGPGVRVDSGLDEGTEVTSAYDPMLTKVVTWAPDRAAALDRMDAALAGYTLLGCDTNVAFLRRLLRTPRVRAGDLSTDLTPQLAPALVPADGADVDDGLLAAAAADHQLGLEPDPRTADRFAVPDGWRLGARAWTTWRLRAPRRGPAAVRLRRRAEGTTAGTAGGPEAPVAYEASVDGGPPFAIDAARTPDGRTLVVTVHGRTLRYARATDPAGLWLGRDGAAWRFTDDPRLAPVRGGGAAADGAVRSPMPGTVLSVAVAPGDRVVAGSPVAVVEAMKMEHTVTAPLDGTVTELHARPGQPVAMDEVLAAITPEAAPAPRDPGAAPASASTTVKEQEP
ncbi:ATP-binding protein [Streptomonospora nanhaiensis]|uniref:ATP-binding protein n=1 Tax=Streptomonospora nanhaiensis TaxID=1323731 RepID=UPI0020CB5AF0|nr:biotin carboxylase N-terminal domain-containing protein [Streptomonospora nanhaiensis]